MEHGKHKAICQKFSYPCTISNGIKVCLGTCQTWFLCFYAWQRPNTHTNKTNVENKICRENEHYNPRHYDKVWTDWIDKNILFIGLLRALSKYSFCNMYEYKRNSYIVWKIVCQRSIKLGISISWWWEWCKSDAMIRRDVQQNRLLKIYAVHFMCSKSLNGDCRHLTVK